MIESLDAVSSSWNATCEQKGKDDASSRRDDYASIYGSAVMDELSSLKVFVVGSGAIGCELLKNFALLGIGQASAGDPSCDTSSSLVDSEPSLWTSYGLQHGGVLVTDMDSIERSNLNRQLLFRERHVGGSKSLIAAQQVRLINPAMRVQGITNKLGPETGVVHPYVLYVCFFLLYVHLLYIAQRVFSTRPFGSKRTSSSLHW
jgi:ubiquitin-activating enzyme E1